MATKKAKKKPSKMPTAPAEATTAPVAVDIDMTPTDPRGVAVDGGLDVSMEVAGGRKNDRVSARHTVSVRGVFSGDVLAEDGAPRTRDISSGGVFIETAHLLEVGDPVVLAFPLDGGQRLVVNGRVRWVTPFGRVDDPTPGMGIEFVGVDTGKLDKLQRVLANTPAV